MKGLSDILSLTVSIRSLWSKVSKHLDISPSINQFTEVKVLLISPKAVWHPLLGLNPCEWMEKLGSKTASSTSLMASWTILSRGDAIPNGRLPLPLALGISRRRAGLNWKAPVLRSFFMRAMSLRLIPSSVSESAPGVMLPGDDFIFAYAAISTSSSATISITLVLTSSVFFKFNLLSFPNFSKPAGRESLVENLLDPLGRDKTLLL